MNTIYQPTRQTLVDEARNVVRQAVALIDKDPNSPGVQHLHDARSTAEQAAAYIRVPGFAPSGDEVSEARQLIAEARDLIAV